MQKKLDLQKPRTENGSRYSQEFTDEQFIKAVQRCMEEATCTAAEVAEKVGCNPQVATRRLVELADHGKLCKKMRGRTWGFRP